ncbi:MAG: hypothetical protein ABFC31_11230 [Clostridiaceae bacterium]
MTKQEIRDAFRACMEQRMLCRTFMKYDDFYRYYIPLAMNERFFLGAEEDDFLLDGFSIRLFRDVKKAVVKNDICLDIARREGILDQLADPDIDLSNWRSIFLSLEQRQKNIIVEGERADAAEPQFAIGRIERVTAKHLYLRHFDGDGLWQEEPYEIPYTEITSVTFGSRYVEVFSKYLPPLPENFGKALTRAPH